MLKTNFENICLGICKIHRQVLSLLAESCKFIANIQFVKKTWFILFLPIPTLLKKYSAFVYNMFMYSQKLFKYITR